MRSGPLKTQTINTKTERKLFSSIGFDVPTKITVIARAALPTCSLLAQNLSNPPRRCLLTSPTHTGAVPPVSHRRCHVPFRRSRLRSLAVPRRRCASCLPIHRGSCRHRCVPVRRSHFRTPAPRLRTPVPRLWPPRPSRLLMPLTPHASAHASHLRVPVR
jgi:hypothetical protein